MNKEYPLEADIRRTLLTGGFLIIGLREIVMAISFFFDGGKKDVTSYVLFLIVLLFAIHYIILAYTAKIIVSPTEITFQTPGQVISIKWQDVESIKYAKFLGVRYEGLFAPKDKATIKGLPVFGKEVSINLFSFSDNWRKSELGQQIRQYAPHLFQSPST